MKPNLANFDRCAVCDAVNTKGKGSVGFFIHEGKRRLAVPYFVCVKCRPTESTRLSQDALSKIERTLMSASTALLENELTPTGQQ